MKRNTTTIYLESTNAVTPLPWVNNAPDFTGFSEPTLSVLQKSWAEFLESGEELEVVPDPEPILPEPEPDWKGFNIAMMGNPDFLNWAIPDPVRISLISVASNSNTSGLQAAIDTAKSVAPLEQSVLVNWQTIADTYSIPVTFL